MNKIKIIKINKNKNKFKNNSSIKIIKRKLYNIKETKIYSK